LSNLDNFIQRWGNVTEEYKFYGDSVSLRYDFDKHKYLRIESEKLIEVPSVTQITHILDKSAALLNWATKLMAQEVLDQIPLSNNGRIETSLEDFTELILNAKSAHTRKLEDASDVGKQAHSFLEDYIKEIISHNPHIKERPHDPRANSCIDAALDWVSKFNVRFLFTERKVYSKQFDFAGTLDGLAIVDVSEELKDRKCLIDWKTSSGVWPEHMLQSAAYCHAFQEETGETIDDRFILRLDKTDGSFNAFYVPHEEFATDFQAFVNALDLTRSIDTIKTRMNIKKYETKEERRRAKRIISEEEKQAKQTVVTKVEKERKARKSKKVEKQSLVHYVDESDGTGHWEPIKS
jgi:hypothetical protein